MSEAPEKIWLCTENTQWSLFENGEEGDIQYIRADLVDELVEALEHFLGEHNGPPLIRYQAFWEKAMRKAEDALAKVRMKDE